MIRILIEPIPFYVEAEVLFTNLFSNKKYSFWLDSNMSESKLSRYSFMGADPDYTVRSYGNRTDVNYFDSKRFYFGSPFDIIDSLIGLHKAPEQNYPFPFIGGFIGYFGYELHRHLEDVPAREYGFLNAPEMFFMFCSKIVIFDHLEDQAYVSIVYEDKYNARAVLTKFLTEIENAVSLNQIKPRDFFRQKCNFYQYDIDSTYISKVEKIKSHIAIGDIYQACLTQALSLTSASDPFDIYRALRKINPAPFSSYLRINNLRILSSSPERFLKMDDKRRLESRPIKGTIRRSEDSLEDRKLAAQLKNSIKDRAENIMIVDLVRNDLSKVCETGSVCVPYLAQTEQYATVHQLVSAVEGQLLPEYTSIDAIKACFPGGSMTGAPKIRAMQILHNLENYKREIYSGGLGYIDLSGRFDLSIVIRSIFFYENRAQINAGGGIVNDSIPSMEYQESLDKLYALKKALEL